MAEIRINATGGLKLYDADDSHYAQIVAGTITSNTDVMTLGHAAVVMGTKLDMNGSNLVLDADADTYLDTGTDDTIKFYVSGAHDLTIGANSINVLSGTTLTIDSGATITNSGTANGFGSADPSSADGDTLGTASAEWSDLYLADGGVVYFGNDQEITLTHSADSGLLLKHTATADDKPINLVLQTGETDMAADDVIGKISFQAPDEGTGTDAVLVSGAIQAVAEGDHSSSSNATRLEFHTGASELATSQMTISSGGIVGIGAVPIGDLGVGLHIKTADSGASVSSEADELVIEHGDAIGGMSFLAATDGLTKIAFGDSGNNDAGIIHYSHDGTHMAFTVEGSEVFRQTTSTTKLNYAGTHDVRSYGWVANGTGQGWKLNRDSNQGSILIETHLTTNRTMFSVINGNGTIGTISVNGSTTSYNTSSDYRLKENVDYDWDATTRLKQLKPARFNWIADDTNTLQDGFIAHEVTSIVPEAVNGEKDAMKMEEYIVSGTIEDDNAVMGEREVIDSQSIDQSKLVPLLVKTIQELEARITALEG